jgi:hypothetical protein
MALVLLSAAFAVAIGGETARLVVSNLTTHVVTVVIGDEAHSGVAPGERVTCGSRGPATVIVRVSYAPGQDVEGSVERSFLISGAASSSSGSFFFGCRMGDAIVDGGGEPIIWNVTADTLAQR